MKISGIIERFASSVILTLFLHAATVAVHADDATSHRKPDEKVWKQEMETALKAARQKPDEAIPALDAAMNEAVLFKAGDERQVETYLLSYAIQAGKGKFQEAGEMLKKAVESAGQGRNPSLEYGCLNSYAVFCLDTKNYAEATNACDNLRKVAGLRFGPDSLVCQEASLLQAEAYFHVHDYEKAEAILTKTLDQYLNPRLKVVSRQRMDPALTGRSFLKYRQRTFPELALTAVSFLDAVYINDHRLSDLEKCEKHILELVDDAAIRSFDGFPKIMFQICNQEIQGGRLDFSKTVLLHLIQFLSTTKSTKIDLAGKALDMVGEPVLKALESAGRHEEAGETIHILLETNDKTYGPDSREVDQTLTSTSQLLLDAGHPEAALPLLERQLERDDKTQVKGVMLASVLDGLAKAYLKLGHDKDLDRIYARQIVNTGSILGENSPAVARLLETRAAQLRKLGDDAGAESLENRARAIKHD